MFTKEKERQQKNIGRIEKIEVQYVGTPEDVTLMMNKGISTPFNCAQRKHFINPFILYLYIFPWKRKYILQIYTCVTDMSEMLMQRSALALIDDTTLWDMNRPLEADCQLRLLHFRDSDPYHVNKAFWRSCSMLLGALAENVFRENIHVDLHSFPSPTGLLPFLPYYIE